MNLLLDTHALLWWLEDSPRLSEAAASAIASATNVVHVSAAVLWECRIKEALGKLTLPGDFTAVLEREPFEALSMTVAHAHGIATLPSIHRDPFDRMLVSQALLERLTLVTMDEWIRKYPVRTLW